MDGTGPEASKRQRLDSYNNVSHRLQQQPSTSQSHGFSVNTLPPPNSSYVPHPLPPSPYHESAVHEHRSLPDPTTHGYTQPHSGQNTPIRDPRAYPLDANYPRRGSTTNSTRSPDGFQQFPTARPVNSTAAGNDGQHYPQPSYPIETAGQFGGYANHDTSLNGNPQHGLPMSTYNNEPVHPNPTGHPSDYNPSPVNAVPHVYAGSNYTGPPNHQNMQRAKKGNRATQVRESDATGMMGPPNNPAELWSFRRVISVERGRRNATKAGQPVGSASRIKCNATIRQLHRPSRGSPRGLVPL